MDGIGDRIRSTRKSLGIGQLELSERLNVTRQAVSQWERGVHEPSTQHLIEMSHILGASLLTPNEPSIDVEHARIRRAVEAERLRMIAQDLKAKAADLEAMAARLERG